MTNATTTTHSTSSEAKSSDAKFTSKRSTKSNTTATKEPKTKRAKTPSTTGKTTTTTRTAAKITTKNKKSPKPTIEPEEQVTAPTAHINPPQDIRLVSSQTPWGQAQSAEDIAPGITKYSTASHGGYFLNPEANSKVAPQLKKSTLNSQGLKGWYEEDCDWAIVVYTFQEYFQPKHYELALRTLAQYHTTAWKALSARTQ